MKAVLAALLLLSQLQPLLGTAICMGFSSAAQHECQMPEHGAVPYGTVSEPGSPPQSCEQASVCAPSPLAVPSLGTSLESVVPVRIGAVIIALAILFGTSSTPPFHPPRA
jgi:hypothetical protein